MAGETIPSTNPIDSGFSRWRIQVLSALAFLSVVYCILYWVGMKLKLQPAEQYCEGQQDEESCSRPDLFAFQFTAEVMQLFMGITGGLWWHSNARKLVKTPEARLFGFIETADRLNAGIFVFQTWDFFFSIMIPEHATMVFLTHHVLAALTAYFSLEYQLVHYYALFFGGCSEISSIFLVFCDFDVYFPADNHGPVWKLFITFNQAMFALLFLWFRVIGWWIVSYQLWKDVFHVKKKNEQVVSRNKTRFLHVFLFMDLALGLLQVYWFVWGMIPKVIEILQA
jgi:hypothetical protein